VKHAGHPRIEEQILKRIFGEVRSRVAGKGKFKKTKTNITLCPGTEPEKFWSGANHQDMNYKYIKIKA
jgi:hypothetical protein